MRYRRYVVRKWFNDYIDIENYVKVATIEDIKENDYNLNIPLYVEKIIEDNLPTELQYYCNLFSSKKLSSNFGTMCKIINSDRFTYIAVLYLLNKGQNKAGEKYFSLRYLSDKTNFTTFQLLFVFFLQLAE